MQCEFGQLRILRLLCRLKQLTVISALQNGSLHEAAVAVQGVWPGLLLQLGAHAGGSVASPALLWSASVGGAQW